MRNNFILLVALLCIVTSCSKDSVRVESISLDSSQEYMLVGDTVVVSALLLPTEASLKTIIEWSSSDEDVVTVKDGVVIAKHSGSAIVTASAANGLQTASCNVTIGDLYIIGNDYDYSSSNTTAYWINWEEYFGKNLSYYNFNMTKSGDVYSLEDTDYIKATTVIKNESPLYTIEDGGNYISADDMVIRDNDVYVVGTNKGTSIFGSGLIPTLWKNGVASHLYSDPKVTSPHLSISGKDTCVAYYTSVGNILTPKIWHNGTISTLDTAPYSHGSPRDIFVSDGDVYVLGEVFTNYFDNHIMCVWKNGVRTDITDGSHKASSSSFIIYDNDLFISGYEEDDNGTYIAKIWKNGKAIVLSGKEVSAKAVCAYIFGDKVYVLGHVSGSHDSFTRVWAVECASGKIVKEIDFLNLNTPSSIVIAQ